MHLMPAHGDRALASQELAGISANMRVAPGRPAGAWASTVASLYCLVVTRMEIKVKNINGGQLLPLQFILLALIHTMRSQVRFSALPGLAAPRRVQKALQQRHNSPKPPETLWSKKAMGSFAASKQKARGTLQVKAMWWEYWLVQDRWSSGERLAYVREGRDRAWKRAAVGNRGVETASLMAWPLFKAPEIACHMCRVSGTSFPE